MSWACNVLHCGGGRCVHFLTEERCPECGSRLVLVRPTGYLFCSSQAPKFECEYEREAPRAGGVL